MKSKKKQKPSWLDVKAVLTHLDQQGFLELISDMYNLSKNNKDFLHTRFSIGDDILAPYKRSLKNQRTEAIGCTSVTPCFIA
jgi:hypothetical protein